MNIGKKNFTTLLVLMVLLIPACKKEKHLAKPDQELVKSSRERVNIPLEISDSQREIAQADNLDDLFDDLSEPNQLTILADDLTSEPDIDWTDLEDTASIKTILFDFDKNDIRSDQKENVAYDVEIIRDQLSAREATGQASEILVEGHTCQIGTANHNKVLSLNRAKAVEQQLISSGIPSEKIKAVGRGSIAPVVVNGKPLTNGTRDQLAPNRRVEVKLINA